MAAARDQAPAVQTGPRVQHWAEAQPAPLCGSCLCTHGSWSSVAGLLH